MLIIIVIIDKGVKLRLGGVVGGKGLGSSDAYVFHDLVVIDR